MIANERIKIRINQLEMMYPDSFHEMSEEKKAGLVFYKDSIQDTDMTGETIVVRHKKAFYYLNFYARTGLLEESLKIWQSILDTIVFEE